MGSLFKILVIILLFSGLGLLGFVVLNIFKIFELIDNFSHGYVGSFLPLFSCWCGLFLGKQGQRNLF